MGRVAHRFVGRAPPFRPNFPRKPGVEDVVGGPERAPRPAETISEPPVNTREMPTETDVTKGTSPQFVDACADGLRYESYFRHANGVSTTMTE